MPSRPVRFALLNALVLVVSLCTACATEKRTTQAEGPKEEISAEETSRQEWEERVSDSSWWVTGEYFSQKDHSDAINLNEWFEGREELEAKQEDTEERLAKLEKAVAEGQTVSPAEPVRAATAPSRRESSQGLRLKVALVVLPEVYEATPDVKGPLLEAVSHQFGQRPEFLLVGPQAVEDILSQQGLAISAMNTAKTAQTLGIYPAARLVLFVDKVALLRGAEGLQGRLDYTMFDGLSGRLVTQGEETGSAASAPDGKGKLLDDLVGRLARAVGNKTAQYAWLSRVAMVEGKSLYLCAGEASGLKPGDVLAVYGPGREIFHPIAKVSMGFQPGPYKGQIKVVKLFGGDSAEAVLVAGEGKIEGNDLVTVPQKGD